MKLHSIDIWVAAMDYDFDYLAIHRVRRYDKIFSEFLNGLMMAAADIGCFPFGKDVRCKQEAVRRRLNAMKRAPWEVFPGIEPFPVAIVLLIRIQFQQVF